MLTANHGHLKKKKKMCSSSMLRQTSLFLRPLTDYIVPKRKLHRQRCLCFCMYVCILLFLKAIKRSLCWVKDKLFTSFTDSEKVARRYTFFTFTCKPVGWNERREVTCTWPWLAMTLSCRQSRLVDYNNKDFHTANCLSLFLEFCLN